MTDRLRVAVMGGSLGGITAALVLTDAGCEVDVFERSRAPLRGRGAGIVLHPATVRYLTENDALELEHVSTRADRVRYIDRGGATVLEQTCRYRFTSYYTLYEGLLGSLDPDRYHLGREVTGFDQAEDRVEVRFADEESAAFDLLVCADGIQSTARTRLLPQVRAHYSGYVGWRGTAGRGELPEEVYAALADALTYYVGPDTHILTYPIPEHEGSIGSKHHRINFVWYVNVMQGAELEDLMTDRDGTVRGISLGPGMVRHEHVEALRRRARAALPEGLAEVVLGAAEPFVQVVLDVEVPRMAFGRVCLIGDAAFAIRPHAAAGTAKAAEDAWQLAGAISRSDHAVDTALAEWEAGQLALGRQVMDRARRIGNASQFEGTYRPGAPELAFGLYEPGDSWMED